MINLGLEIGSHSRTHPILTKMNEFEMVGELEGSMLDIIKNLDVYRMAFCYPNGQVDDYDYRISVSVRDLGYLFALVAHPSPRPLDNKWAINRYPAGNDLERFIKNLYGMEYVKSLANVLKL